MDEININPMIHNYLNHCKFEKGLALKAYGIDLTQFDAFVRGTGGNYHKESIQAYTANLHGKYAVKSVKRKIIPLSTINSLLQYFKKATRHSVRQASKKQNQHQIKQRDRLPANANERSINKCGRLPYAKILLRFKRMALHYMS